MPGGDRTGPQGIGPKTGRAVGFCSGYDILGYVSFNEQIFIPRCISYKGFRRGPRRGFGRGLSREFQQMFFPDRICYLKDKNNEIQNENEKKYLENMIKQLEAEIQLAKDRIQKISAEKKE